MQKNNLQEIAEKIKNELAPKEKEYNLIFSLQDKINKTDVHIFRYEPVTSQNLKLHAPHVTVILDNSGNLKGFARLSEDMVNINSISESKGKEIALSFFKKYAPDLVNSDFQWTDDYSEKIIDKNGRTAKANGLWVKFREKKTGHYLWVMVAPDGSIMEFDRDIIWSFFRGGRVNELWLRDEWLGKKIKK